MTEEEKMLDEKEKALERFTFDPQESARWQLEKLPARAFADMKDSDALAKAMAEKMSFRHELKKEENNFKAMDDRMRILYLKTHDKMIDNETRLKAFKIWGRYHYGIEKCRFAAKRLFYIGLLADPPLDHLVALFETRGRAGLILGRHDRLEKKITAEIEKLMEEAREKYGPLDDQGHLGDTQE